MNQISAHKTGVALGLFMAFWHLAWSILVVLGLAQGLINFIFQIHFINPPYTIMPFKIWYTVMLLAVTFVVGYVAGVVIAYLWNKVHK